MTNAVLLDPSTDGAECLTRAQCRRYGAAPLSISTSYATGAPRRVLRLAVQDATDIRVISNIRDAARVDQIEPVLASLEEINERIEGLYPLVLPEQSTPRALSALTGKSARRYDAIPLTVNDGVLVVGVTDPTNRSILRAVTIESGGQVIDPVALPLEEIKSRIAASYPLTELNRVTGSIPALLDDILSAAQKQRASDIHLEPTQDGAEVLFSVDNHLRPYTLITGDQLQRVVAHILNEAQVIKSTDTSMPHDGPLIRTIDGRRMDLRIATIPTINGTALVMRVGGQSDLVLSLEESGLRGRQLTQYLRLLSYPEGLTLVSGPVRSGKSSFIHSSMKVISTPDKKSRSVENPVETPLHWLTQTQIDQNHQLDFKRAIQQFVRMNTRHFFIGEMRDTETIHETIGAALLGHKVFATMHAGSALKAVRRLTNQGVEREDVAEALTCIVGIRLVELLCNVCKVAERVPSSLLRIVEQYPDLEPHVGDFINRPIGCDFCSGKGYSGEVAIFEILETNDDVEDAIVAGTTTRRLAAADPMYRPLIIDGLQRVLEGQTTIDALKAITRWPFDEHGEAIHQ